VNLACRQINSHALHDCTEELRLARKLGLAAGKRQAAGASALGVGGGALLVHTLHDVAAALTLARSLATGLGATAGTSALSVEGHALLLWLLLHALHSAVGRSEQLLALGVATALLVPLERPKRAPALVSDRRAPRTCGRRRQAS